MRQGLMAQKKDDKYTQKATDREKRRARRRQERRCRDIRRRVGGCIFALGVPLLVTGCIILIVTNVNRNRKELPTAFEILGPLFTCLSVVFFVVGALLTELITLKPLVDCIAPNNPETCPSLFRLRRRNREAYIDQQAALQSLQSAPAKSAMRKPPNPDLVSTEAPLQKTRRGVTFSGSDANLLDSPPATTNLDPDKHSAKTASQTSLASLRHCKVFPTDNELEIFDPAVYTVSQSYFEVPAANKVSNHAPVGSQDVV